jgi:hypothetical protein
MCLTGENESQSLTIIIMSSLAKKARKRLPHTLTPGDLVLIKADQKTKHGSDACAKVHSPLFEGTTMEPSEFSKDQQPTLTTYVGGDSSVSPV